MTNGDMSSIKFKFFKHILISRLYEQFFAKWLPNGSGVVVLKNSNFKNMNILYITLKHVIWRFR